MAHDCIVGAVFSDEDSGVLRASEFLAEAAWIKSSFEKWAKNPHASPQIVAERQNFTPWQFVNGRCLLWDYCPECGKKHGAKSNPEYPNPPS